MSELILRNRQRARPVNLPFLRRIARVLLTELFGLKDYELGLHLVAAREMAWLNGKFLNHKGSTDVITFDYSKEAGQSSGPPIPVGTRKRVGWEACPALRGEILLCIDDALRQARQFRTTWQSELVRYLVHGALHLCGYDDLKAAPRRLMKREEKRLLQSLSRRLPLGQLANSKARPAPGSRTANRKPALPFPLSKEARKPRVRP